MSEPRRPEQVVFDGFDWTLPKKTASEKEWSQRAIDNYAGTILGHLRGLPIKLRTVKETVSEFERRGISCEESHVRTAFRRLKEQGHIRQSSGGTFEIETETAR